MELAWEREGREGAALMSIGKLDDDCDGVEREEGEGEEERREWKWLHPDKTRITRVSME